MVDEVKETLANAGAEGTAVPAAADTAAELAAAREEIERLKAQLKDQQLRALADLENLRKRADRDARAGARFGAERVVADLLGVCDSLELGLQAATGADATAQGIAEGLELTHRQLQAVLQRHGVAVIDPAGETFDPHLHEAVATEESTEAAPNQVLRVMQKGYRLHERVLRPARVVVARALAPHEQQAQQQQ